MADVVLWDNDWAPNKLPMVCMRCGKPATEVVNARFTCARETSELIGGVIAELTKKSLNLTIPVCHRHRNLWTRFLVLRLAGYLVPALCVAGLWLVILFWKFEPGQNLEDTSAGTLFGVFTVGIFVSVCYLLWFASSWRRLIIHSTDIQENHIVLSGVAKRFVDALKKQDGEIPSLLAPAPSFSAQKTSRDPTKRSSAQQWGIGLILLGVGVLVLPLFGLQFRPFRELGEGTPILAVCFIFAGGILVLVSRFSKRH